VTAAKSPTELHDLFAEYLNTGDLEGLVALYEPQAKLVMPDGQRVAGSELRRVLSEFLVVKPEIRILRSRATQEEDLALISNDWQLKVPDGDDYEVSEGTGTEVARRQSDGSWLYVIDDAASTTTVGATASHAH
jgi:ketosteroid isomerase-like protein